MKKFRLYFDKDKETTWLNNLAAQGYAMTSFFAGLYTFEKTEPGKYIYQIDLGDSLFSTTKDYREFMEDTGVEIVQNWGYWIILRKLASDGNFDLYTDVDSSIEHYTKICRMFKVVSIIELVGFFMEVFSAYNGFSMGIVFMLLLGLLAIVLTSAAVKTNQTINRLKEQKGILASKERKNPSLSPLLPLGMLLNAVMLYLRNSFTSTGLTIGQIIAVVLIFVGSFLSLKNVKTME